MEVRCMGFDAWERWGESDRSVVGGPIGLYTSFGRRKRGRNRPFSPGGSR